MSQSIGAAMHSGVEKHVKLKEKIPVHIVYFTAWVDENGGLHFQPDIYGYDQASRELSSSCSSQFRRRICYPEIPRNGLHLNQLRLIIAAGSALSVLFAPGTVDARVAASALSKADFASASLGTIDADVFELALDAASAARSSRVPLSAPRTLTVIDYSQPSTETRLWVFDLKTRELLYEELVAHGQGSGANMATKFSNNDDSHQTSLGLFVTDTTYVGKNGYSLRLDGLDKGFNDRARDRAIVMHGAPYVSEAFVQGQRPARPQLGMPGGQRRRGAAS